MSDESGSTSDAVLYSNSEDENSRPTLSSESCILDDTLMSIIAQDMSPNFWRLEFHDKLLDIELKLDQCEPLLGNQPMRIPKSNDESSRYRELGMLEDCIRNRNKALFLYNKSIAFAEKDYQNLYILYKIRAQTLHEIKLFKASLHSLELAIKYCPTELEEEHKRLRENFERNRNASQSITECIKSYQPDIDSLTKLKNDRKHPDVPFIANCLELRDIENYGRGIFTNCDLNPGDVVAIDRAYVTSIFHSYQYRHCSNCFKENWSLIPCPDCTTAMYCNEKCLQIAWKKFHKHECKISNYLMNMFNQTDLMSFRLSLQTIELFGGIDPLIEFDETHQQIDLGSFDIFNVDHDDDGEVVHYAGNENYNSKMTTLNYHPVHGLIKDIAEPSNLTFRTCLRNVILTLLIYRLLDQIFPIITDDQQLFVKKFIYRNVLAAKIYCYGLGVTRRRKPAIYYALTLYPFASLINHSCAPNLLLVKNGTSATIIVLHPIKTDEQLFYHYGYTYMSNEKKERQEGLEWTWDFECQCTACLENYPELDDLPTYCIPCEYNEHYFISGASLKIKDLMEHIKTLFMFRRSHVQLYPCKDICYYEDIVEIYLSHLLRRLSDSVYMNC